MIALDSKWLQTLLISDICDLMTEVKYEFLSVKLVNSEKAFKEYTSEFKISAIPYPGVEYFKDFVDKGQLGDYPVPPWKKWKLEPSFGRPMRLPSPYRWNDYKTWNTRELTQNIVRYLLSILRDPHCTGILLHCISGWDRTPHAISLLRILLWAEGEAHQSLSIDQFLYLTVAYDWFLFGHQLSKRLKKSYEIMYYTFDILGHLLSSEFSLYLGDYIAPESPRDAPTPRSSENSKATSSSDQSATSSTPSSPPTNQATSSPEQAEIPVLCTETNEMLDAINGKAIPEQTDPIQPTSSETSIEQNNLLVSSEVRNLSLVDDSPLLDESPIIDKSAAIEPTEAESSSPPPSPSVRSPLELPPPGTNLADRRESRTLRLFELRERFFHFYRLYILPTYKTPKKPASKK